jgi:hypothetical protein
MFDIVTANELDLRFPSSWTDSITPTRCDALRSSHLSMFFLLTANAAPIMVRPQLLGDAGSARHPP